MKHLQSLNKYLLKYKWRLLAGFIFVALSNWFGVFPAQVVRLGFDLVLENIDTYILLKDYSISTYFSEIIFSLLFFLGVLIIVLTIIKGIFMFFMRQTIIVVSRLIEYDLKNDIYRQYQHLSHNFFKQNNTGDLMNRVGEDVTRVRMYLGPAIMYTINLLVLFILVVSTMIQVNPTLTFYSLLPLPLLFVVIFYVQNKINQQGEEIQEELSNLSTFVQENFSGIRVIKSYQRELNASKKFEESSNTYRAKALGLARIEAFFYPSMLFLIGISILLTLYVGGIEAIKGNITGGNIAEFMVYVNMLTWPVASVGWVTTLVQRAAASQKRINEFLELATDVPSGIIVKDKIEGTITFENVSYTYQNTGIQALKGISFSIPAGMNVGILGRTGAGKSTIAQLMVRMFDVDEGAIKIDGINIRELSLPSLRKNIGYVPQGVFLFSESIKNNIQFSTDLVSDAAIIEAAKQSVVDENIQRFPHGYDTLIGERGITLSGGQKQRLTIARALLTHAPILIFDDCLSAVDTSTEEAILKNLEITNAGATKIMISHRVSTLKNCEFILVIEDGQLVEQGTKEALMLKKGLFYDISSKQQLENDTRKAEGEL